MTMKVNHETAAHALEGMTLNGKWKVLKKIEPKEGATGGFFSVCYLVTDGEQEAFLKALNFRAFFQLFKGKPIVDIINEQTAAYTYEKELLGRCKRNRLSKVSLILDEGEAYIEDYTIGNVPYLIFERAEGDARGHLTFAIALDTAWKLKSLHNVAVGIRQLHGVGIGHQDLKPSNVLLFDKSSTSKIGDLGRSLCEDIEAPHEDGGMFPGDVAYAPPEFLYRYIVPEWELRVMATDLYLLGSLIVFYFTGTNMNALLGKNMDKQFRWDQWGGNFEEVLDYLLNGFYKALEEFKVSVGDPRLADELKQMVEYLCFPDPEKRGHPRARRQRGNPYDLQRTIARLDYLHRVARIRIS